MPKDPHERKRGNLNNAPRIVKSLDALPPPAERVLNGELHMRPKIDPSFQGGFWLRVVATLVDGVILFLPNLLIQRSSSIVFGMEAAPFAAFGINSFLALIYYGPLQAFMQGTFGKRIVGLALVTENFEQLTLSQAMVRYAMSIVSGVTFGLGYLWVAWDENKQSWHDRVAGTLVLRRDCLAKARQGGQVHVLPPRMAEGRKAA